MRVVVNAEGGRPAIFEAGEGCVGVRFPDLPFGFSLGDDENKAREMAGDLLESILNHLTQEGTPPPQPGTVKTALSDAERLVDISVVVDIPEVNSALLAAARV